MAVGDLNTAVSCTAPSCRNLIEPRTPTRGLIGAVGADEGLCGPSMAGGLKSQQTRQGAGAALEVGAKSPTGNEDHKTGRAGSKIWFDG